MKKIATLLLLFIGATLFAQEVKIEVLEFSGLKRTKESFLRRLVKTKEQTIYDVSLVNADIERLKRLPGIASATYDIENRDNKNVLIYTIVENYTIIPGLRIATANDGSFSYRVSAFEFNLFGNNQLLGGFYEKNIFNSYGAFWEHPFLFSDKLGIGINYQDLTTQEPVFYEQGEKDYRFNSKNAEAKLLFSFDFKNEAELGAAFVQESYLFEGDNALPNTPLSLEANKLIYKGVYRFVDLDIDYQYFDGIISEFTAQHIQFLNGDAPAETFLNSFSSFRNDLTYYKKIQDKGNWASRLRLAAAFGNDDSPFAPFTLDNQLNIRGVGTTVDRGTASIVLNTEYRHTLYEKGWFVVQGNAFVDAGSWRNPGEEFSQLFDGSSTKLYPGVGFRFIHKKIFNAVFRLDYGVGIGNDTTNGIVFGIGQYF
ncbi:POTRA domain-containing protein [Maribacter sp. SA7]|uniref:POTRA domain-containing protein n=1 Tax=Maribacter zhoushanensis TaxID=3030012 RepID=UPI0023EAD3CB|nr:POTRA domain-containing protein [Maribacter zhoushanensis]MDF4201448.1 POTRA domain-containing protein [Maribacter zhoushanensis]